MQVCMHACMQAHALKCTVSLQGHQCQYNALCQPTTSGGSSEVGKLHITPSADASTKTTHDKGGIKGSALWDPVKSQMRQGAYLRACRAPPPPPPT